MNRSLLSKFVLIIVLVALAAWILYPPSKTLKPGLDLAGGTSLIYEIDASDFAPKDRKNLSENMITILRRRIDPANIQNLVWRPQGNTRFEIQVPLASAEARQKRQGYEKALRGLLEDNINVGKIMRSLKKAPDQRSKDFQEFARQSPERETIFQDLATAYDQHKLLQDKNDELLSKLQSAEESISAANLDLAQIKTSVSNWAKLDEQQLTESLTEFLGSETNLTLLREYVKDFSDWADVTQQLTEPETGKNEQYKQAKKALDQLSLTEEQINALLSLPLKSSQRADDIGQLKDQFPDREEKINTLVEAYANYYPFRGRLDDPKDIQRMLKGAGILEFRILPTQGRPELTTGEIDDYIESLKTKGPKYASDERYVWCQIENFTEWNAGSSLVGSFGDKYYVLASNQPGEVMLHATEGKGWKLVNAGPTLDRTGRRAIDFVLDDRAAMIFGKITVQKNWERPLCILLDGLAISAPHIQARITNRGIITGRYTDTQQEDMVSKLRAGVLPAKLIEQPVSVKTIGPSIGADNRDKGIRAAIIGFIFVAVCMAVYYTRAGSIADVALFLNMLFILAIMVLIRATFTLYGIAGLILTIGMSVDANVLIFERIREEQKRGSSLGIAIKNGYQKAFRTIIDANLTTFIVAAILYRFAPEEVKGFAIVLMLGIISSMFTALFVTRVVFDTLLSKKIIKDHLIMLQLIRKPNINWMAARPVFLTVSALLILASLTVFFIRDDAKNNKFDIEFTGGTSVTVNLKETISRQDAEDRIHKIGFDLNNPALAAANVYSVGKSGKQYEITTTETNKITATVTFPQAGQHTVESVTSAIKNTDVKLINLLVTQKNSDTAAFTITTSEANKTIVKNVLSTAFPEAAISEAWVDEVVNDAILKGFGDILEIQRNLKPTIISVENIDDDTVDAYPELGDFLGGIKITCQLEIPATAGEIEQRFQDLSFKPDMRSLKWYLYKILNPDLAPMKADQLIKSFVYVSVQPEAGSREFIPEEIERFIQSEKFRVTTAAQLETSLPRVTQINPSVGSRSFQQALIAIVLSLCAIVGYIWFRFGSVRYGIAAIAALLHDVCITLGAVTACTYIAGTTLGDMLLIGDFKISVAVIAAFLTIIGYSLNDTIVVFDRIRENRQKKQLQPEIISESINQTLSRTILTSFTTFAVVLIMYIFGGQALRAFTFAIGLGIIIGTYSSVAIAAPILLIGTKEKKQ